LRIAVKMKKVRILQQKLLSSFNAPPVLKGVVAAAVSGGVDSVAMLLLLVHYCRMNGLQLCVFHVDHALRDTSQADRIWVEELTQKLGLDFYWRRATSADMESKIRPGSEAWARQFRYRCFVQMQKESGASLVATGHTADDQAETMLMRMLRGCGIAGAGGIRSIRNLNVDGHQICLWRPLLALSRSDLQAYLIDQGQGWCEDETNQSEVYFRNQVRHRILTEMNHIASGASRHLAELADELQQLHALLTRLAKKFMHRNMSSGHLQVKIRPPAVLRREVIRLWLIETGLGELANRRLIGEIDRLWAKKGGGRQVICGGQVFCRRKDEILLREIAR
jgi:tRNA(Ile)-lysidine synthase